MAKKYKRIILKDSVNVERPLGFTRDQLIRALAVGSGVNGENYIVNSHFQFSTAFSSTT